jgi:hypothetical protein
MGGFCENRPSQYTPSSPICTVRNCLGRGIVSYSNPQTFNTKSDSHSYSGTATDKADYQSAATTETVKVDASAPTVSITGCPTGNVLLNSSNNITVAASNQASGLVSDPSGTVALDTSSVGSKSKQITVNDKVGHSATAKCGYSVIYNYSGFFQPIDNPTNVKPAQNTVWNSAKSGSAIPVKFSLSGNQGLDIFYKGDKDSKGNAITYLTFKSVTCLSSSATVDAIEEYSTTTNSGLKYDATADQYNYTWKTTTQLQPAASCQQLTVKLNDGTTHVAFFKFTK